MRRSLKEDFIWATKKVLRAYELPWWGSWSFVHLVVMPFYAVPWWLSVISAYAIAGYLTGVRISREDKLGAF